MNLRGSRGIQKGLEGRGENDANTIHRYEILKINKKQNFFLKKGLLVIRSHSVPSSGNVLIFPLLLKS